MISNLKIKNFKSHFETQLSLSSLNIFTGMNGVGKSSVFQALLLLRQSYLNNQLHESIDLNKSLCSIGLASDAIHQNAKDDIIEFGIEIDNQLPLVWQAKIDNPDSTFLNLVRKPDTTQLENQSLFNQNFQYISAARLGPQKSYPKDSYAVEKKRQISLEAGKCELIANFLNYYGAKEKIKFQDLKYPGTEFEDLLTQTSAWCREISRNININIEDHKTDFELKYYFNTERAQLPTNQFKAENVGFGISYALPIIVAALSAEKDSIILIENPESHLHPYGQAKLAELLSLAAHCGVQIFVETHSDHIINGILVSVKKFTTEGKGISHEKVKIYYFDRDETNHATRISEIPVSEDARIVYPPEGFFDQLKKDIKILMGF